MKTSLSTSNLMFCFVFKGDADGSHEGESKNGDEESYSESF